VPADPAPAAVRAPAGEPSLTLASLRPAAGSDEAPTHRRVIAMEAYERDEHIVVIGTLHDERPWASGELGPRDLHHMELAIVVRRADLVIVDAAATMDTYPHAECPTIEPAFSELIGLSVGRGYTNEVQARFGRQRGCSHLEFLARALGPVVIQSLTSGAARQMEDGLGEGPFGGAEGESRLTFLTNTCHLWAEDGIGLAKVALGWRPGRNEYPAPSLVEIRGRAPEAESPS
jgi:hypothetical protein